MAYHPQLFLRLVHIPDGFAAATMPCRKALIVARKCVEVREIDWVTHKTPKATRTGASRARTVSNVHGESR